MCVRSTFSALISQTLMSFSPLVVASRWWSCGLQHRLVMVLSKPAANPAVLTPWRALRGTDAAAAAAGCGSGAAVFD